ncbi:MAG: hypothetical protein SF028_14545 [Candidatus Sumerlaeia bacterium]|nr:hypothetical protein [Candidatus Sumerlaeia bacterium]
MLILELPDKPRFPLGRVFATPRALAALGADDAARNDNLSRVLARHATGDWGEVGEEDSRANEQALRQGTRLLSAYIVEGQKLWIITEGDRSATTALLPEEY